MRWLWLIGIVVAVAAVCVGVGIIWRRRQKALRRRAALSEFESELHQHELEPGTPDSQSFLFSSTGLPTLIERGDDAAELRSRFKAAKKADEAARDEQRLRAYLAGLAVEAVQGGGEITDYAISHPLLSFLVGLDVKSEPERAGLTVELPYTYDSAKVALAAWVDTQYQELLVASQTDPAALLQLRNLIYRSRQMYRNSLGFFVESLKIPDDWTTRVARLIKAPTVDNFIIDYGDGYGDWQKPPAELRRMAADAVANRDGVTARLVVAYLDLDSPPVDGDSQSMKALGHALVRDVSVLGAKYWHRAQQTARTAQS